MRAAWIARLEDAEMMDGLESLELREARRSRLTGDDQRAALHQLLASQARAAAALIREAARRDGWDGRADLRTLRAEMAASETIAAARREMEAATDSDRTPTMDLGPTASRMLKVGG